MTIYNRGIDIPALLATIPEVVDRAIILILSRHVGRDRSLPRQELLDQVKDNGYKINDRSLRLAINRIRKSGVPICSTGGQSGGYWTAAGWQELNEYLDNEVRSRITDLKDQEKALVAFGLYHWGIENE